MTTVKQLRELLEEHPEGRLYAEIDEALLPIRNAFIHEGILQMSSIGQRYRENNSAWLLGLTDEVDEDTPVLFNFSEIDAVAALLSDGSIAIKVVTDYVSDGVAGQ